MSFPQTYLIQNQRTFAGTLEVSSEKVHFQRTNRDILVPMNEIEEITMIQYHHGATFTFTKKDKTVFRVASFGDVPDNIKKAFEALGKEILYFKSSVKGHSWGDLDLTESFLKLSMDNDVIFDICLDDVSQTIVQGKNEVALELHTTDKPDSEDLMEIRFYTMGDEVNGETPAMRLCDKIMNISDNHDEHLQIAKLEDIMCLVPRGKYSFEIYDRYMKMINKSFSYKITYQQIVKLFVFESEAESSTFVIALDPPIRQGNTSYPFLVLQISNNPHEHVSKNIELHLSDEELKTRWENKFETRVLEGAHNETIPFLFYVLTEGIRITKASKHFLSSSNHQFVNASYKTSEGQLYMMRDGIFFLRKPTMYVKFEDVQQIQFDRLPGGDSGINNIDTRSFDLIFHLKNSKTKIEFTTIATEEFDCLFNFLNDNGLNILYANQLKERVGKVFEPHVQTRTKFNKDEYQGMIAAMGEDEEDEDDEEYDDGGFGSSSDDFSSDEDDDNSGSDMDDDDDDAPKKSKEKKEKKPKKEAKKETVSRKKSDSDDKKKKKKKEGPKRPITSYIAFCNFKRGELKERYPEIANKIGELAGKLSEAWKNVTPEERRKAEDIAAEDKARYKRELDEFNAKQANGENVDSNSEKKEKKDKKDKKDKKEKKSYSSDDDVAHTSKKMRRE